MSLDHKNQNILTTDKAETEAIAGTMNDVKLKIMVKMGLKAGYNPLSHSREHLLDLTPTSADQLPKRSMQDSFTSAIIPLSTDIALRDKYIGFLGNIRLGKPLMIVEVSMSKKIILGRLMEDMFFCLTLSPVYHFLILSLPSLSIKLTSRISMFDAIRILGSRVTFHGLVKNL